MTDIILKIPEGKIEFDISVSNADLMTGDGLMTAVFISLFTWARAKPDDELAEASPKFGWWGDQLAEDKNQHLGSRLWLLQRKKLTQETINLAVDYIKEALAWMVQDGVVGNIDVIAEKNGLYELDIKIILYRNGAQMAEMRFSKLWQTIAGN